MFIDSLRIQNNTNPIGSRVKMPSAHEFSVPAASAAFDRSGAGFPGMVG
jgi:hypothetical protein